MHLDDLLAEYRWMLSFSWFTNYYFVIVKEMIKLLYLHIKKKKKLDRIQDED